MSEKSMFFNAKQNTDGTYDRTYEATDFAEYFADFIGNGVYNQGTSPLKVMAKSGLVVTVKAGTAFIDGYKYSLTEDKDITLTPNTSGSEKQTVIAVILNMSNREITVQARENVTSILPVSGDNVKELVLASIKMTSGASSITQSDITDRRASSTYCGWVTGVVQQIDSTDLFAQFEDAFNTWFEGIKNQLSTDAAGKLQIQIDNLTKESYFYKDLSGVAIVSGLNVSSGFVGVKMKGTTCTIFGRFITSASSGSSSSFTLANYNDISNFDSNLLEAMKFNYKTSEDAESYVVPYLPLVVYGSKGTTREYYPGRISVGSSSAGTGFVLTMSGDFVGGVTYEFYVTYICKGKTS